MPSSPIHSPPRRTIAIGDIHGCSAALAALIAAIDPQPHDCLVTLGDYVDRGNDSRGVLDQLIALASRCRLVPLLGNHEEMLLAARRDRSVFEFWMECGGRTTLDSYGNTGSIDLIPDEHVALLQHSPLYYETAGHFFVHANYDAHRALEDQDRQVLLWLSLRQHIPGPHCSGKTAVIGHTPQAEREILDLGHLKCLDTACCLGGWLTALDVTNGQQWQVNEAGEPRQSGD
jgi:serine/threonine protein phosphatase 1